MLNKNDDINITTQSLLSVIHRGVLLSPIFTLVFKLFRIFRIFSIYLLLNFDLLLDLLPLAFNYLFIFILDGI